MQSFILTLIKTFLIMTASFGIFRRALRIKPKTSEIVTSLLLGLVAFIPIYYVRFNIPALTITLQAVMVFIILKLIYKKDTVVTISLSLLSTALGYSLFTISVFLGAPVSYFVWNSGLHTFIKDALGLLVPGIITNLIVLLTFRIKRLKNGLPNLTAKFSSDISVFIGVILVFLCSWFMLSSNNYNVQQNLIMLILVLFGTFLIFVVWRRYIHSTYISQVNKRNDDVMEQKILEQQSEIDNLSKVIHKDNKLLSALELAVKDSLKYNDEEKRQALLREIEAISSDRENTLRASSQHNLTSSGLLSVDIITNYLYQKSFENNIAYEQSISANMNHLVETCIPEKELSTLLADLGENAIIAVKSSDRKRIMLNVGIKNNCYFIDLFDSGAPFADEVINNLGIKKTTTHKNEGGSGIGLMSTMGILKSTNASLEIEHFKDNELFTKRVSVVFDNLCEKRITK